MKVDTEDIHAALNDFRACVPNTVSPSGRTRPELSGYQIRRRTTIGGHRIVDRHEGYAEIWYLSAVPMPKQDDLIIRTRMLGRYASALAEAGFEVEHASDHLIITREEEKESCITPSWRSGTSIA